MIESIKKRRSQYNLTSENFDEKELFKDFKEIIRTAPSSFNSLNQRIYILTGENHNKMWDITLEELKKVSPNEEAFAMTKKKIDGFKQAYGTILFYEDLDIVRGLQNKFPLYKDNFPSWSVQQNAMLQVNFWNTISSHGYGASLQHYNPLIDERLSQEFNIPKSYKLIAQMPFGVIKEEAKIKQAMQDQQFNKMIKFL